jgi:hypothetical protein
MGSFAGVWLEGLKGSCFGRCPLGTSSRLCKSFAWFILGNIVIGYSYFSFYVGVWGLGFGVWGLGFGVWGLDALFCDEGV